MKRAAIFLNGDPPSLSELRSLDAEGALVICADGAYRYLCGAIKPDVLVADFDSLSENEVGPGVKVVRYPANKDYTDGHLCAEYALENGCFEADFYGAFGGRPDMEYANVSLLVLFNERGGRARLHGGGQTVTLEEGTFTLKTRPGARVSLEPLYESAHILSSKGLKYPADGLTLFRVHALGVSNEAIAEEVSVTVEGKVLVFIEDAER